jgi:hypothetical protein
MLLALLFLPVALVVITIGLPILILIASMGVMGIVMYSHICTKLSGCTTTNQSSSSTSVRIVMPPTLRNSYRYNDHQYYSRTSSPPPSPCMMVPEYRMSSSLSPLRFRYKSNAASPPSPTSSMHDINVDGRNQQYDRDSQLNRRRRVRFA